MAYVTAAVDLCRLMHNLERVLHPFLRLLRCFLRVGMGVFRVRCVRLCPLRLESLDSIPNGLVGDGSLVKLPLLGNLLHITGGVSFAGRAHSNSLRLAVKLPQNWGSPLRVLRRVT
jgi:hypothetical protein